MKAVLIGALGALLLVPACNESTAAQKPAAKPAASSAVTHIAAADKVEAGRYFARVAGCHDCHTPGWMENGGTSPQEVWLTGVPVGFQGPWGTSYPANLRRAAQGYDEAEWVERLKTYTGLPPMPWQNLHEASEEDLAALHAYLLSLGEAGAAMPVSLPPGQVPQTPYFVFMPVMPETAPAQEPGKG